MIKNTLKLLTATALLTSLAACSSTIDRKSAFFETDGENLRKTSASIEIKEIKKGESANISIDGKEYKLATVAGGGFDNKTDSEADKIVKLANLFSKNKGNADVNLWSVEVTDNVNKDKTYGGFIISGNETKKMPTKDSATYTGNLTSVSNDRTGYKFANTKAVSVTFNATVDFEKNKLSTTLGKTTLGGSFDVTNQKIDSNGFGFSVTSDNSLNNELNFKESVKGDINGLFYGDNADVMAGVGILENTNKLGIVTIFAEKQ
ncbi:MAG: transferrin-binding protein-like solute binding protein [Rhizobiales bacterium]|nr:transferrin-binding protein-like solute binding protein [Hyphomicrobiales bacterium]